MKRLLSHEWWYKLLSHSTRLCPAPPGCKTRWYYNRYVYAVGTMLADRYSTTRQTLPFRCLFVVSGTSSWCNLRIVRGFFGLNARFLHAVSRNTCVLGIPHLPFLCLGMPSKSSLCVGTHSPAPPPRRPRWAARPLPHPARARRFRTVWGVSPSDGASRSLAPSVAMSCVNCV